MLTVEQLRVRLGRFTLDVDRLEVPAGAYFLLLGPSGCGKTALLETLAGLNRPERGRVTWGGADITRMPPERRGVGFVYQKGWLFPHLTVAENIRFGLGYSDRPAGADADGIVRRAAETVGVAHLLDRYPRKLSGGETQRAALARALATRPRLLFLDEPLGPLDPPARERLAGELKAWHREFGTTTIHVTHDHLEARTLADGVAVMFAGRVAQVGPVAEVFGRPVDERTARFVGVENIWRGESDGEAVRVGDLALRPASAPPKGMVGVCLRAEEVRPADGSPPDGGPDRSATEGGESVNRVSGEIAAVADRGPVVRLTVRCRGTDVVFYETQAEARRRGLRVGAAMTAEFPAAAIHVIPG